jgi:asparagine N-glycosylation enzyme membrane subunit Stt3
MKDKLSKDSISAGFRNIGKFRVNMSHGRIISLAALFLILFIAFTIRVLPLRWEIPTGAVHLGEFDPYYQFTITNQMVQHGLLSPYYPTPYIETHLWYPQGLDLSHSLPGLPMTAAVMFDIVKFFGGVNVRSGNYWRVNCFDYVFPR